MAAGGTDDGAPGLRHYHPSYYGAFLRDSAGNRIEAVSHHAVWSRYQMRVFLAGATGVIGRRLAVMLRSANHDVAGTTRTPAKVPRLRALGITPIVVDVLEADALAHAVATAHPDIVIHQLTDLPSAPGTSGYPAAQEANRRLRIEGTRNLMRAARLAGARRAIAQSIAFVYAPGEGMRIEDDPLDIAAEGVRQSTVQGIVALEREILDAPGIAGVVLRYGYLYGPDTWYDVPPRPPSVHADAAAHAALLAVSKGGGVYNIADDDGVVSTAKAVRELGFDPAFRIPERLIPVRNSRPWMSPRGYRAATSCR